MAHPEDLEKLRQGPKAWNVWRQENPDHIPDLRDAELTMSQRQFGPANGGPIDLSDSDLQGMVLRHSTLTDALLIRANLVATDLVQARLEDADLTGADLTDAVLDYSDLTGANLNGAILVGTSLVNATGLTQEQIEQSHGDASTALPAYLLPPESWFPPLEGSMFEEYDSQIDLSPLSNDPYEVLGVSRDATFDQIRSSFRTLVKKLHPDLNPDDTVAQERFKRVSIAYRILGDPVKRDRYNRGEIDANGDVHPEFEAKKEFRRYAYKFYAAAIASLLLAAGILGAVWHTFWLEDINTGPGNTQIAEAGPPKLTERLGTQKLLSVPMQRIASAERQQAAPNKTDGQAVASSKIAAVAAAVEASRKLTDGDAQNGTVKTKSARGSSVRSAQQPAAVTPDRVAPQQSPNESTYDTGSSGFASTDTVVELTFPRTSEDISSAAPPSPINQTNAVKSALSNKKLSRADQQKVAELTPGEATTISQSRSGSTTETASIIEDENNKLVTLIKDIKTLAVAKPTLFPTYRPQWPSAVNVILRYRREASLADDDITDVFRHRTKAQLQNEAQRSRMAMTANSLPLQLDTLPVSRDSLQIPRQTKQAQSEIATAKPNFIDSDFEVESSRTVPIKSHDVNIIQLRPLNDESVVIQLP